MQMASFLGKGQRFRYILTHLINTICMFVRFTVSKGEFTDVYNVEGGIHAYATRVDPSVGTY